MWFCLSHLYSESVILNPLNIYCAEHISPGSSMGVNRSSLGNIFDSHYRKLSLDIESAVILQSFKRQNYYSFGKRRTEEK